MPLQTMDLLTLHVIQKAMLAAWEEVERLQQRVSDIEQRVERATFTMQLDQQIAALV